MAGVDPDEAREQAEQILAGDRYRPSEVPRPFQGILRWVGDRMASVWGPVAEWLATPTGTIVAVVAVTIAAALVGWRIVARRGQVGHERDVERRRSDRGDPAALEAEADAAEARGELDQAVRLRFRAGVLRLEEDGSVPARPDATTGRLQHEVPSVEFPPLARRFDEVAYGGRRATAADVAEARRAWPVVRSDARRAAPARPEDGSGASGSSGTAAPAGQVDD